MPSFAFKAASSELCPPPCYALLTPYTRTQTHTFERTHSVPLSQSEHSGRKPKVFLETVTWQGPSQPLPQSQRSASGGCWPGTLGPAALGSQASLTEPWTSRTSRLGCRSSPWLLARKPKWFSKSLIFRARPLLVAFQPKTPAGRQNQGLSPGPEHVSLLGYFPLMKKDLLFHSPWNGYIYRSHSGRNF